MMTSIDFGCYGIRAMRRSRSGPSRVHMVDERSEYCVLSADDECRDALLTRQIPYAECEEAFVVFGNKAMNARWLSRKPLAPLFTDGQIPTDDAPARQILSVLTQALISDSENCPNVCCFTAPGGRTAKKNIEFLHRLIAMQGVTPVHSNPASAAILASGNETNFTGIAVVIGAETCDVSISRYGVEIAAESIGVGANWIDTEIARQFSLQTWDELGECYLDLESVREWKHDPHLHLRNTVGEREKTLARLYSVVLNRVAICIKRLLHSRAVTMVIGDERLAVICAGGPTQIGGFAGALTERLVEHDTAQRILSINPVEDASTAVVRGLLIQAELEKRRSGALSDAA